MGNKFVGPKAYDVPFPHEHHFLIVLFNFPVLVSGQAEGFASCYSSAARNTNQSHTRNSGSGSESVSRSFGQPNGLMRQVQAFLAKRRVTMAFPILEVH